jgi:homoserine dehydrogenase
MFYGRGAGGAPTASAILGDIVAVARNRISGGHGPRESTYEQLPVQPIGESTTRYYISLDLADKAGVLAAVAAEFATHCVSIETLRQDGHGDDATLLIVTHTARERDLAETILALRRLDSVREVTSVMRVVGE